MTSAHSSYLPEGPAEHELTPLPGAGPAGTPGKVLDREEIKGILQRELEDGLGGLGSQVSEQRRIALRHYYGRPLGNEIKDRSTVVSRDVLEVVEWTMPSLMRMFCGGAQVVRYQGRDEESDERARHATADVNYDFMHRMEGFNILHDWFKTALIEKNGIVKAYWDKRRYPTVESYEGLSELEAAAVLDMPDVEPLAAEEREEEVGGGAPPMKVIDLTIRKWNVRSELCVDGVPPEEFIIARRAIKLDDETPFTAHRKKMLVSDLVAMGFDFEMVANLPNDETPEYSQGRTERLSEDETFPVSTAERTDPASREIWVTECHIRIDEDGDGYAELRKILIVGEHAVVVLEDEEETHNPFCSITPVPVPHKFFGLSLADLVQDLQIIRSTIMRQILDHMYLANNPRLAIVEGMVEIDDLLTVQPGGLIRQRAPGNIEPVMLPPLPPQAFDLLTYLEDVRSNRTGIMAHGRELDASAINSTATGMASLMAEKAQKIELIARIFAGTGLKRLFKNILRLKIENSDKPRQLRFNGKWIDINPADWDKDMDLEVVVGLGAGQAIERIANLEKIMQVQKEHVSGGMLGVTVTKEDLHATAVAMAEAAGFANEDMFFTNPEGQEMPPPPPDPAMKKIELDAQIAVATQEHKMAELQLAAEREKNLVAHRHAELQANTRVKLAEISMRERLGLGQQEATVEAAEINAEAKDQPSPEEEEA